MAKATIGDLEGGTTLCAWFEGIPSFHDATLRELELRQGALGRRVAPHLRMGSGVDAKGTFLLTKHVDVTLTIYERSDTLPRKVSNQTRGSNGKKKF